MEKQLNYSFMLSLEQIALRRIAVALYSESRILASIKTVKLRPDGLYCNIWKASSSITYGKYKINPFSKEWRNILEDKMSKLQIPESLTKKLTPILKAIGSELFAWISIHTEYFNNSISRQNACLQKLCWTTVGTVDYRKTAEELVCCDLVDIAKRFELACLYCLEDRIPLLWEELPDAAKKTFCASPVKTPHLQLFLPHILKKHSRIKTFHEMTYSNPFEEAVLRGNKTLAVYCFWKLTKEEREASLIRTAKNVIRCRDDYIPFDIRRKNLSDIACYLLSLMTPEEQMGIFRELPCEVLRCFLDWPWQDLFLDVVDVIWTFLPERLYCKLICTLRSSMQRSGCYSPSLFQNLFLRSPVEFRRQFVEGDQFNKLFFHIFFNNEDTETVKVIFRSLDAADRMRLVSHDSGLYFIEQWRHRWDLLEAFLRAARLSKENKERLKADFIAFEIKPQEYADSIDLLREEHRKFFEFLEETGASAGN